MPIPELSVSDRVHVLLRNRKESIADLAAVLGLHRITLHRKLTGQTEWRAVEVKAVAVHYDVPVGWLYGEEVR